MDFQDHPTPGDLAGEIQGLLRSGATAATIAAGCPMLLLLPAVRAKSPTANVNDCAAAAHGLLRELVIRVDGQRAGASAVLLGLAPGTRRTLLKERRRIAAELLNISPAHLRTGGRERALLEAVADEMFALDSAFRLRHQHRTSREQEPMNSRLEIDWLARHETYRRIWTPIAAMRADVDVLLGLIGVQEDARDPPAISDRLVTISWRYAQYLTELERFIAESGGLWLLADADSEFAAADALYRISVLLPFGDADDSWLRLLLEDARSGELDTFGDILFGVDRGKEVLGTWLSWARQCRRDTGGPGHDTGCQVHQWTAAVSELTRLLDSDWIAVADWYRTARR